MIHPPPRRRPPGFRRPGFRPPRFALVARGAILGALLLLAAAPARAWFYGGIAVAPPIVVGPPVVYPPPAYYPPTYYPPPAYYPPPVAPHPAGGQACYAGAYVCPLDHAPGTDGSCSCPSDDNGGRVWGHLG